MTMLICPECRHENEPERIYCRSCGARLDRSALATKKPAGEKPEQVHRRLRRMFDPHRGKFRRMLLSFCKLLLAACVAAIVVEMILPLDLQPASKTMELARQINFDIENATTYHQPPQLRYTQDEVNAYLAYALKSKQKALDKSFLKFNRAVVWFTEGTCTITVERSLFGYSIYDRASYDIKVGGGKIAVSHKAGWIGRLPIAPGMMPYVGIVFADLWSALNRERKLVAKMAGTEFHDGYVVLNTPVKP
jgi:hypothetical protein